MSNQYDKLIEALKQTLPEENLSVLGRMVRFVRRLRCITSAAFVWAVVLSRFGHKPGFEQARQKFHELSGRLVFERPFQLRFRSRSAVRLMEEAFEQAVQRWRARPAAVKHPLQKYFTDIVAYDASPVAVADQLRKHFKGLRMAAAQIKVLLAVSVFGLRPIAAQLVSGHRNDLTLPPALHLFREGTLLLFDRGFVTYSFLRRIQEHKQFYVCLMRAHAHAKVVGINDGPKWAKRVMKRNPGGFQLRDVLPRDKRIKRSLDLDVLVTPGPQSSDRTPVRTRLIIMPGPDQHQRPYLTNIETRLSPAAVRELYRLRWQIELTFKELKQHLSLESVPTKDPNAAQVFIWASLIALAVSRAVASALLPAKVEVGLACTMRPALVTRTLRSMMMVFTQLITGPLQRAAWAALLLLRQLKAVASRRPARDSLRILRELLPNSA